MNMKQKFSAKNVIVLLWKGLHAQVANLINACIVQMCQTIYLLSSGRENWKTLKLNGPVKVVRQLFHL